MSETTSKLVAGLKIANQHVQSLSHGIMPVQIDSEGLNRCVEGSCRQHYDRQKDFLQFLFVVGLLWLRTMWLQPISTELHRKQSTNAQRHGNARNIQILLNDRLQQIELESAMTNRIRRVLLHTKGPHTREWNAKYRYRHSVIGGELSVTPNSAKGTIGALYDCKKSH